MSYNIEGTSWIFVFPGVIFSQHGISQIGFDNQVGIHGCSVFTLSGNKEHAPMSIPEKKEIDNTKTIISVTYRIYFSSFLLYYLPKYPSKISTWVVSESLFAPVFLSQKCSGKGPHRPRRITSP
jgi:hypothetical protein